MKTEAAEVIKDILFFHQHLIEGDFQNLTIGLHLKESYPHDPLARAACAELVASGRKVLVAKLGKAVAKSVIASVKACYADPRPKVLLYTDGVLSGADLALDELLTQVALGGGPGCQKAAYMLGAREAGLSYTTRLDDRTSGSYEEGRRDYHV